MIHSNISMPCAGQQRTARPTACGRAEGVRGNRQSRMSRHYNAQRRQCQRLNRAAKRCDHLPGGIRFKPDDAQAFSDRGAADKKPGQNDAAIADGMRRSGSVRARRSISTIAAMQRRLDALRAAAVHSLRRGASVVSPLWSARRAGSAAYPDCAAMPRGAPPPGSRSNPWRLNWRLVAAQYSIAAAQPDSTKLSTSWSRRAFRTK